MNKFSKMMGVTALSMSLTLPAFADVSAPVNNNQQVHNELAYAFGENTDLQAKAITNQEMKDTQGAFGVPGAVAGAGIGAWGYLGTAAGTGNFSWKGLAVTTAGGAVVGAVTGPVGIARYYTGARVAGAVGFLSGRINK